MRKQQSNHSDITNPPLEEEIVLSPERLKGPLSEARELMKEIETGKGKETPQSGN